LDKDAQGAEKAYQNVKDAAGQTAEAVSSSAGKSSQAMKGLRDDAAGTAKELQSRGAQAAEFFGQIQNKVIALAAAVVGFEAVKGEVVGVTNATADLGRAAAVAGVDLEKLSAFGNLIARNGGDAAAATAQVQGFVSALEQYKLFGQASDQFKISLGTIGYSGQDTPFDVLEKAAAYAGKNQNDPAKVSAILGGIGITDNATLSELLKGQKQYNIDLQESIRLGIANKGAADAARDLQEKFKGLGQAVDQLARDFLTKDRPQVDSLLDQVTGWVQGKTGPIATLFGGVVGGVVGTLAGPGGTISGAIAGAGIGAFLGGQNAKYLSEHSAPDGISSSSGYYTLGGRDPRTTFPTPAPQAQTIDQDALLHLIRSDENSADDAVSTPAFPGSHGGAVGRYQIKPATAKAYGFDPSRLKDPAYNEKVARAILDDLSKKYNGNIADILIGYNSTPGYVDKFNKSGGDVSVLLPETQSYLARAERLSSRYSLAGTPAPSAKDSASSGSGASSSSVTYVDTVEVHTQATDAPGIASSIKTALQKSTMADQANTGLN
jgi:hypothetical protein